MPPSKHSSSSHSSSYKRSSSRSSSSHRPSSHSRSSHSSSYSRRSSGGYHSKTSTTRTARTRHNQPSGYTGKDTRRHYGRVHDYVYYPTSWVDSTTGISYKKGYYDEEGTHYDYVAFKKNESYETMLTCDYCGTEIKAKWTTGVTPQCPNCGAALQEVMMHTAVDEEAPETVSYGNSGGMSPRGKRAVIAALVIFLLLPFANSLLTLPLRAIGLLSNTVQKKFGNANTTTITTTVVEEDDIKTSNSSIYINEIGRTCYWDTETESYYDPTTDCYFWYDKEIDPPQWHYWYEAISSDYGEYGWMEYDASKGKWYIEVSDENWVELPDSYDTSNLWHTESVED